MYGYSEFIQITPEQLLQKVTQQQVFEWVFEQEFYFKVNYNSIFRKDKNPGCRFEEREDGTILFIDYGEKFLTGRTHRNFIMAVMDRFGLSYQGAINAVCDKFGLSGDYNDYDPVIPKEKIHRCDEGNNTIITYTKQPYSVYDKREWSQYLISVSDLEEDNVFSVQKFTKKNRKGTQTFFPRGYCYAIDFGQQKKIYQPKNPKFKWLTNCDEDCIGNIDNLPRNGRRLIISKAYKDHRIIRNLFPDSSVVWFQNEGCTPSEEIMRNLTERFELITLFFDSDEGGIKAAHNVAAFFNAIKKGVANTAFMPINRHNAKDIGEYIPREGRKNSIKLLNYIGIYGDT